MLDPETEFALKSKYKLTARKGYVKDDCSKRSAKALLRRSGPIPGPYRAGDVVCFRRHQRRASDKAAELEQANYEATHVWSTPARIIGFGGQTVWVLCEGITVATAMDKLRPCTAAEILAHEVLSRGNKFAYERHY